MDCSLINDGIHTIWTIDGTVYRFGSPTRDEVEGYHKVRQYHAIENVLSEVTNRRECNEYDKLPTMEEVASAALMLQELEDNDDEWHLLLEEAVDEMERGEFR